MHADIANFLWVGNSLSLYEAKCIESFVKNGFKVHVYSYGELAIPDGAILKDGGEVLPLSEVYSYTQAGKKGNLAAFSDAFRYELCKLKAGWWFDTDVFCLKNVSEWIALAESKQGSFVFGWESDELVNGAVMFSDNEQFNNLVSKKLSEIGKEFVWGEIGPRLITKTVSELQMVDQVVDKHLFYPINFNDMSYFFDPSLKDASNEIIKNSFCVHLWNEIYSIYKIPKNLPPPSGSFLNELLSIHSKLDNLYSIPQNVLNILFEYPFIEGSLQEHKAYKNKIESLLVTRVFRKLRSLL
ncbi:hypothetical protein [Methylophilus sp. OH31]|uniref:hypothetical protein n=1 Tax=Methylophilus sp. OH31 TaxID=1387312 RepID=UPI000467A650|nr:hypothetical protein [Methylophilus sp. OH31]